MSGLPQLLSLPDAKLVLQNPANLPANCSSWFFSEPERAGLFSAGARASFVLSKMCLDYYLLDSL